MNRLLLGINRNGFIFKVTLIPFHSWANYFFKENEYLFDIRFSAETNINPSVLYKNLRYTGNITSKSNWKITLDYEPLVVNHNNEIKIKDKCYINRVIKNNLDLINAQNSIKIEKIILM